MPEDGSIDYDAPIGEEFEIKGVRYRAIEDTRASNDSCDGCALKSDGLCGYYMGNCGSERVDGKTILFERVSTKDTCKSSETADMRKGQKPLLPLKEVDYKVIKARGSQGWDLVIDSYIRTIEYDGCEYLIYVDRDNAYSRGVGMTHKGNCRYCKERRGGLVE